MKDYNNITSEEWLAREDMLMHKDRLDRLNWLDNKTSSIGYWTFSGGVISKYLFEEAKYCFVYGQFLATIVLGMAYIEHALAAIFYAAGRNDIERASISILLQEAVKYGLITQTEFDNLNHARNIRNPITHFRKPLDDDTLEYRALKENEFEYTIIEEDARHIMEVIFHLLDKFSS